MVGLTFELTYRTIVIFASFFIAARAWRLYRLSHHRGIQLFSQAFAAAGFGFLFKLVVVLTEGRAGLLYQASALFYYYLFSIFGFLLVYSLVWKDLNGDKALHLHLLAGVFAVLAVWYGDEYFLFLPQLAVLGYAIILSYAKYRAQKEFMRIYLFAIVLVFIRYVVNFLADYAVPPLPAATMVSYGVTTIAFLLVLIAVLRGARHG